MKYIFEKKKGHPQEYSAPEGSARDKHLDSVQAMFKRADKLRKDGKTAEAKKVEQRAYKKRRDKEADERAKDDFKNVPRSDTKKESYRITTGELRNLIREVIAEALSAKTKKSLDKKADKRGLTRGSVYKEFEKGLAAFARSGSRKGMSAHQWAHARVNSATPSKSWAVVKKSKAKKE